MISESINTKPTLEKDTGQPRWPKPDAEKRSLTSVYTIYWKYQKKWYESING